MNTLKSNNQLTIGDAIPKNALINDEAKKESLINFKNFQGIKTFGRDIYEGKISLEKANEYQTDLLAEIINFKKSPKPRSPEKKQEKKLFFKTCIIFLKAERKFLMLLKVNFFWQNLRVWEF